MNVLSDQHKFASKGEFNNTSKSLLKCTFTFHYSYRLIVKQIIDEMCRAWGGSITLLQAIQEERHWVGSYWG